MSPISKRQIQLVQIARRSVERLSGGRFDGASYRLLLRAAGVRPAKGDEPSTINLTQSGFEYVMAALEEYGLREPNASETHWRSRCNGLATTRQVHLLKTIAAKQRYPLDAMVRKATSGRSERPEDLTVAQAHKLIEAYKSMSAREAI